jgi:Flp pilus assembly pilin Flp
MRGQGVRITGRKGQATTEWAVLVAVITVAVVAAGYLMAQTFPGTMGSVSDGAARAYASGDLAR